MNEDLFPDVAKKQGEMVTAYCCDKPLQCEIRIYSNGTRHAHGTCPICGKPGPKKQNLAPNIEELKHRLMWIKSMVFQMKDGEDKDEAIAMVERCADEMWRGI